jgi:hypothetical protein
MTPLKFKEPASRFRSKTVLQPLTSCVMHVVCRTKHVLHDLPQIYASDGPETITIPLTSAPLSIEASTVLHILYL